MRSVSKMILYARRVLCIYLTLVLISVECSSIRINFQDAELPKEESKEYNEDLDSIGVENPPAPVPIKIRLNGEDRDNLLLRLYSEDKLQKLIQKTTLSKRRVTRQAPSAPLYPSLTPSPYQSHSVQYYNNSSPNSNSQYGQTNSYNQQWQRPNNTQNYPGNPAYPSYNPNTYGPSGFPNPYVQYNITQFGGKGPHPQNFPSLNPGNYSNQPNVNPNQRPPNYPPNSNNLPANTGFHPSYNPSQRPPYYQPGNNPVQNTSSRYPHNISPTSPSYNSQRPGYYQPNYPGQNTPNYNTSRPVNPSYNPSQRPGYYQPGNYPAQNTPNYNSSGPLHPSYNPSQRPPYYPQNFSSSLHPNQNSSTGFFNTTPRSSFGQTPSASYYSNNQNSSNSIFNTTPRSSFNQFPNMNQNIPFHNPFPNGQNPAGFPSSNFGPSNQNSSNSIFNTTPRSSFNQFPNMNQNNPFYNPYPNGQNPAGFPSSNFGNSNFNSDRFREEDLFKPVIPRTPNRPYDPNKSAAENFAGY